MHDKGVNKFVKVLAISILLPLGVIIPFFGIESHYGSSINAQSQDESLKQRITNYKRNLQYEVRRNQEDKMKLRCEGVITYIETLNPRLVALQKSRNKAYSSISNQLEELYKRLEAQAFETSKLKTNLDELNAKLATFSADMKSYRQASADMIQINCRKEPIAFIAALETARTKHDALVVLVSDIREYIANTIKPTLQQVRTQIEDGQTVGGDKQ
jgi:DNA repair exonuclease SbcCD ATPase subunit